MNPLGKRDTATLQAAGLPTPDVIRFVCGCDLGPEGVQLLEYWLLLVFTNQTTDEQEAESTRYRNGIGFSGRDSDFLSSVAKQIQTRPPRRDTGTVLSENQARTVKRLLANYANQIAGLYLAGLQPPSAPPAAADSPAPAQEPAPVADVATLRAVLTRLDGQLQAIMEANDYFDGESEMPVPSTQAMIRRWLAKSDAQLAGALRGDRIQQNITYAHTVITAHTPQPRTARRYGYAEAVASIF